MESKSFEALLLDLQSTAKRRAARHLEPELAADVAQESVLTLWRKGMLTPSDPIDERRLLGMLNKVTDGLVRNARRGRDRESQLREKLGQALLSERPDPDPSSKGLESMEPIAWLSLLSVGELEVLGPLQEGARVDEIARELGLTPNAVSARLSRARGQIRRLIEEGVVDADR